MTVLPFAHDMPVAMHLLEVVSSGSGDLATLKKLLQSVESVTPFSGLIALEGLPMTIYDRLDVPPDSVITELLQSVIKGTNADILAAWPAYNRSDIQPVYFEGRAVGFVGLFAHESDAATLTAVNIPLRYSVQIVVDQMLTAARSEQLLRNQYEFVRVVTHDLRSPLTAMHGFATMLEEGIVGELNDKQHHYIGKVVRGTTQLAALIENIADAGRYDPETGFYVMSRSAVDLNDIVRSVARNYIIPAEKLELTLHVVTSEQAPIMNIDHNMIERAAINLVDNAIKYTPNGGQITVGVRVEAERVVLYVSDTGLGISPENMRKLFQRHVRLRLPEHRLVKGVGLGLFIVRSVALRHSGEAFVESELNSGSTFGIWLPLNDENLLVSSASIMAK